MKTKMKVMLVLVMVFCFALVVSAPMVLAAQTAPAKKAATMQKMATKKMHKARVTPNAEVKAAQEALNKQGAMITADGIMGKQTRNAVKAFQKKNMLKVTGKLDKETLAKLK
jgi:peptidoglycan hydrolase-like protein with peptidoglycan-binding domain